MANRVKEPYAVEPRRLASGRWKGRVVRYNPDDGKRLEMNRTFDTKREAKQWAEVEAAKYREDPNRKAPSEQGLGKVMEDWLAIKRTLNLTDKTLTSYREIAAHIVRELGDTPVKNLSPLQIQQFYAHLAQSRQLSPRTIRYVHTVLKMALNDAVDWGTIPTNPAAKVKVAVGTRSKTLRIPTPEEMAELLKANQDTRWYSLWVWFVTTGSRMGEAVGLRWSDINWERQSVTIQQAVSGDAAKRVIKTPKTVSGRRTLALDHRVVAVLQEYKEQQQDWRDRAGAEWQDTGLVFTTFQGKMLSKRSVDRAFKSALAQAGLPGTIRVHDLRHGVATQWLAAGINPVVVSKRLGHSNVAFTLQVYGHVLPNNEAQAAEEMAGVLLPARDPDGPQAGRRRL